MGKKKKNNKEHILLLEPITIFPATVIIYDVYFLRVST